MKCQQCSKPAMITYEDGKIALCLDCNLKFQQAQEMIIKRSAEMINYLTGQIESSFGFPGMFPRYQISTPIYKQGDMTLNNINIKDSNVGAINTGNVKSIDVSLSVIKGQGDNELSELIKQMTEEIIKHQELTEDQKNEVLDQLVFVSEQATITQKHRKVGVLKSIFSAITGLISNSTSLLEIWEKIKSLII